MSIKKRQAILKCFIYISQVYRLVYAALRRLNLCFVILRSRVPVKIFKSLNDRQSYILSKFHKIEKFQLI